jgi:hypothetical protein
LPGSHRLLRKAPKLSERASSPASVPLVGELCSEPLGIGAIAAGRMPAPPLLPRDRVGAFVDDRVPAAALLRHVALHRGSSFPDGDGHRPVEGSVEGRCLVDRRAGSAGQPD